MRLYSSALKANSCSFFVLSVKSRELCSAGFFFNYTPKPHNLNRDILNGYSANGSEITKYTPSVENVTLSTGCLTAVSEDV